MQRIHWQTEDGPLGAWRADPPNTPRGGIVVIQEIFGVNRHIRTMAERFAAHGFVAVAPCLFDGFGADIELDYDASGVARGRDLVARLGFDAALRAVHTAAQALAGENLNAGAVGYCWGGTLALLANTRLGLPAVSYYGGRTMDFLGERLRAPMLMHFGRHDPLIPPENVVAQRVAFPEAAIFEYDAGHGFNCDQRGDYDPAAAAVAQERTLAFFEETLRA